MEFCEGFIAARRCAEAVEGLLPIGILLAVALCLSVIIGLVKPGHIRRIRSADRALKTLAEIDEPARKFGYLRTIDPFVFEEMILTALKKKGHKIRRNRRYTGDGGIDGRATIDGQKHLIQAKRYRGHINAGHVEEFAAICKRRRRQGLFVHTGKTGPAARNLARANGVEIVSGDKLLELLDPPAKPFGNKS